MLHELGKPRLIRSRSAMGLSIAALLTATLLVGCPPGVPPVDPCADVDCDDGDACTTDTCTDGACSNTPIQCDAGEVCVEGECVVDEACAGMDCDDGDPCTTDTCTDGVCANDPIECPDGETCVDGVCMEPEPVASKFVGSSRCLDCHGAAAVTGSDMSSFLDTAHADALASLEAIGQGENANCLGCHTVGFGEEGGFVDRATTDHLANVGCENCHGAGKDHVDNPGDASLRPPRDIGASVCGQCHTGSHHPNFEQWEESGHSGIDEEVAGDLLAGGFFVNNCGACHSGDVFVEGRVYGEEVAEERFAGLTAEDLNPITCAVCHNPHARTANAEAPDEGRDYQLRFPQVVDVTPSNVIADVTDPSRYNLCGQCHHSRGRTWVDTSRAPHHSVQSNVYFGELPTPDDEETLVAAETHIHQNITEQCSGCHMYRQDFESEQAPAISGHTFEINFSACAMCHGSAEAAETLTTGYHADIQGRLDAIAERLGDPSTWEYVNGDPPGPDEDGQADISDGVKQVRFLYHFLLSDGSLGVHNPRFAEAILDQAESILDDLGM